MNERRSLTAWLPSYSVAQCFLRIIEGTSYRQLRAMFGAVLEQTGTPQSPVDWSDPGAWIQDRLTGDDRKLALRLWVESDQAVNPRYCGGPISVCETHKLIVYSDDTIALTDAGIKFLENDAEQLARMDDYDGILLILSEIAAKSPVQRKHIFDAFRLFCHTHTTWRTDGSVKDALGRRLENLLRRDLIEKSGRSYRITIFGLDYLEQFGALTIDDNVEVSGGSNDKGVDVVADIELGISRVREVVQVKRWKDNVNRPVLDQLRGSLHYFEAVRGTIITTSGFTKGTKDAAFLPGVAPITLIDGETLLDLLIEHDIGIRRCDISILEFDADSLREFSSEEELEAASIDEESSSE